LRWPDEEAVNSCLSDAPGKVKSARHAGQALANMNKDDIQLLYEYDRWANNRVLQAAAALSVEQLTRDLGGSFRSVRDTLLHIIAGEWGWLAYWKEPVTSAAFVADLIKRRDALFHPEGFLSVAAVRRSGRKSKKNRPSS
jgi:hypothetical protein